MKRHSCQAATFRPTGDWIVQTAGRIKANGVAVFRPTGGRFPCKSAGRRGKSLAAGNENSDDGRRLGISFVLTVSRPWWLILLDF
jgi:hypothetical protein